MSHTPGPWVKLEYRQPEPGCQILCSDGIDKDVYLSNSNLLTRHADDGCIYIPARHGAGLKVVYWAPVPPAPQDDAQESA